MQMCFTQCGIATKNVIVSRTHHTPKISFATLAGQIVDLYIAGEYEMHDALSKYTAQRRIIYVIWYITRGNILIKLCLGNIHKQVSGVRSFGGHINRNKGLICVILVCIYLPWKFEVTHFLSYDITTNECKENIEWSDLVTHVT